MLYVHPYFSAWNPSVQHFFSPPCFVLPHMEIITSNPIVGIVNNRLCLCVLDDRKQKPQENGCVRVILKLRGLGLRRYIMWASMGENIRDGRV